MKEPNALGHCPAAARFVLFVLPLLAVGCGKKTDAPRPADDGPAAGGPLHASKTAAAEPPAEAPPWQRDLLARLQTHLDREYKEAPLAEVVKDLRKEFEVKLLIDPGLKEAPRPGTVTLKLKDVPLESLLKWIARSNGLRCALREPDTVLFTSQERIASLGLTPLAVDTGVLPSGELAPWRIWYKGKFEKKVSFEFVDTPLSEGVEFIRQLTGSNFVFGADENEVGDIPLNLKLADMPLDKLWRWILYSVEVQYGYADHTIVIDSAERLRKLAVKPLGIGIDTPGPGTSPEALRNIRVAFESKVSFEFVDTPLDEAIEFMRAVSRINMVVDPRAFEGHTGSGSLRPARPLPGGVGTLERYSPVTLKLQDMPLHIAMKWIVRDVGLEIAIVEDAVLISTPEQLAKLGDAAVRFTVPRKWLAERNRTIHDALDKKLSFEFVETPLSTGLDFLRTLLRLDIIVDPAVVKRTEKEHVSLKVNNVAASEALRRMLTPHGLDYRIEDGVILITKQRP